MRSTRWVAAQSRETKTGEGNGQAAGHTPERRRQVGTGAGVQEVSGLARTRTHQVYTASPLIYS
jgi:hypothetical protein